MKQAEDGSHIICSACEMFDSRKQSQNGKVICTRKGRPCQYGMMKDHVYNEFHKESIKRFIMNKDGESLEENNFKKKYGHKFQKRKKATSMTSFFPVLKKKQKPASSKNPCVRSTNGCVVELTFERANDSEQAQSIITIPPSGGAYSCNDQRDKNIQRGLRASLEMYSYEDNQSEIKLVKGLDCIYSKFHHVIRWKSVWGILENQHNTDGNATAVMHLHIQMLRGKWTRTRNFRKEVSCTWSLTRCYMRKLMYIVTRSHMQLGSLTRCIINVFQHLDWILREGVCHSWNINN